MVTCSVSLTKAKNFLKPRSSWQYCLYSKMRMFAPVTQPVIEEPSAANVSKDVSVWSLAHYTFLFGCTRISQILPSKTLQSHSLLPPETLRRLFGITIPTSFWNTGSWSFGHFSLRQRKKMPPKQPLHLSGSTSFLLRLGIFHQNFMSKGPVCAVWVQLPLLFPEG